MNSKRDRVGWRGYIPATVTPFDREYRLDTKRLGVMLDWLHGEGMHGLVIAGTTGEWPSMSGAERCELFSAVGAQLRGKLPLIAGCGALSIRETIAYAEHAKSCGFEGLLISPPPYLQPNDDELVGFYQAVARGVKLPICVYNWPPGTNIDMSVEVLTRISDIDQVVAIKQSTADLRAFVRTVFELDGKVRVFGYALDEHALTLLRARGGDGTMGSGGVLGRCHPDFYNHIWAGRYDDALACGRLDRKILTEWCYPNLTGRFGSGPAIMKAAFKARGIDCGHMRPPLLDLTPENELKVKETLRSIGMLQ